MKNIYSLLIIGSEANNLSPQEIEAIVQNSGLTNIQTTETARGITETLLRLRNIDTNPAGQVAVYVYGGLSFERRAIKSFLKSFTSTFLVQNKTALWEQQFYPAISMN